MLIYRFRRYFISFFYFFQSFVQSPDLVGRISTVYKFLIYYRRIFRMRISFVISLFDCSSHCVVGLFIMSFFYKVLCKSRISVNFFREIIDKIMHIFHILYRITLFSCHKKHNESLFLVFRHRQSDTCLMIHRITNKQSFCLYAVNVICIYDYILVRTGPLKQSCEFSVFIDNRITGA